ncbi:MAG: RidA family protein [bacterium]|nr:RidA family protein [bacterium]MDE0600616.1 RidA family protein [bacterium]
MLSRHNPPGASPPAGRYSLISVAQAGATLVWLAGQTGRRADGSIAEDAATQTRDAFSNLIVLMESVGGSPSDVACLRTYLTPGAQEGFYQARDRVFSEWYPDHDYPVNTLAVVSGLADTRAAVEIEAVLALY